MSVVLFVTVLAVVTVPCAWWARREMIRRRRQEQVERMLEAMQRMARSMRATIPMFQQFGASTVKVTEAFRQMATVLSKELGTSVHDIKPGGGLHGG